MSENNQENSKYLIQILVDHASPEAFYGWIDKGTGPHIIKYILGEKQTDGTYANATISRNIVTGYPSTSANSHTTILTGSFARKSNLTHTCYWDLTGKLPEYNDIEKISLKGLKEMNYKHINPQVKTLFEYTEDSASFHALNRGATYKLFTPKTILFKFLPLLLKIKKTHGGDGVEPHGLPEFWHALFKDNISSFLKRIQEKAKFPKATFIVYLHSDDMAHRYGFNSENYKIAMELVDYLVKCIVEGLEDKKGNFVAGIKELGYLDSTIWNICTDHAGRRVFRDKFIFINSLLRIEQGLNIIDGEMDDSSEIIKNNKKDLSKINAFSEIAGENYHCWFGGPNGKKTIDFRRFYGEEYFRKITPKLKNTKHPVDIINYSLKQEFNQFVILPEENPKDFQNFVKLKPEEHILLKKPREYSIKIFSTVGIGEFTRSEQNGMINYSYKIQEGDDPLDYGSLGLEYGKIYSQGTWLEKSISHNLPDVPHRLFGFFDSIYAPNFAVTSAYEYHYLSVHKLGRMKEKYMKDYQTHGGLFGEESVVPLTIAGPGIKKGFEIPSGRNIDILPTLLKALNLEFDSERLDGKILDEIFE